MCQKHESKYIKVALKLNFSRFCSHNAIILFRTFKTNEKSNEEEASGSNYEYVSLFNITKIKTFKLINLF